MRWWPLGWTCHKRGEEEEERRRLQKCANYPVSNTNHMPTDTTRHANWHKRPIKPVTCSSRSHWLTIWLYHPHIHAEDMIEKMPLLCLIPFPHCVAEIDKLFMPNRIKFNHLLHSGVAIINWSQVGRWWMMIKPGGWGDVNQQATEELYSVGLPLCLSLFAELWNIFAGLPIG